MYASSIFRGEVEAHALTLVIGNIHGDETVGRENLIRCALSPLCSRLALTPAQSSPSSPRSTASMPASPA